MSLLGYAYLHSHLGLTAFDPSTYARRGAVTRVTATTVGLLVPVQVAGKTQTLLDHVLFALKHEGINMQVLAQGARPRDGVWHLRCTNRGLHSCGVFFVGVF